MSPCPAGRVHTSGTSPYCVADLKVRSYITHLKVRSYITHLKVRGYIAHLKVRGPSAE